MHTHHYAVKTVWEGNTGEGTVTYKGYERRHTIAIDGKPSIPGSSDPSFRGDKTRYNPEELLLAALSACHMLSYLHACAVPGVVVTAYEDHAEGTMAETPEGGGYFTEVVLKPVVTVKDETMVEKAMKAHHQASEMCFIAASVNFPVHHKPACKAQ